MLQVSFNPLWAGTLHGNLKRKELYSHPHKNGAIWALNSFIMDDQTILLSVSSDGTVRGGFVSTIATCKTNDEVMQLFRIRVVDQQVDDNTINERVLLSVSVNGRGDLVPNPPTGTDTFEECNLLSLHCIDSMPLLVHQPIVQAKPGTLFDKKKLAAMNTAAVKAKFNPLQLVAYGGAAGLMRIHSFDPFSVLVETTT